MKELLSFLITNITGSDDFEIIEEKESDKSDLNVKANPNIIGLIIGKQGKTIKNLRRIVAIKATLLKKAININVTEK